MKRAVARSRSKSPARATKAKEEVNTNVATTKKASSRSKSPARIESKTETKSTVSNRSSTKKSGF
jgi:hypothetical protein